MERKREKLSHDELKKVLTDFFCWQPMKVVQRNRILAMYDGGVSAKAIGLALYAATRQGGCNGAAVGEAIIAAEMEKAAPVVSMGKLTQLLYAAGFSPEQANAITSAVSTHPDAGIAYRIDRAA